MYHWIFFYIKGAIWNKKLPLVIVMDWCLAGEGHYTNHDKPIYGRPYASPSLYLQRQLILMAYMYEINELSYLWLKQFSIAYMEPIFN